LSFLANCKAGFILALARSAGSAAPPKNPQLWDALDGMACSLPISMRMVPVGKGHVVSFNFNPMTAV
jgi:hypothetical protein